MPSVKRHVLEPKNTADDVPLLYFAHGPIPDTDSQLRSAQQTFEVTTSILLALRSMESKVTFIWGMHHKGWSLQICKHLHPPNVSFSICEPMLVVQKTMQPKNKYNLEQRNAIRPSISTTRRWCNHRTRVGRPNCGADVEDVGVCAVSGHRLVYGDAGLCITTFIARARNTSTRLWNTTSMLHMKKSQRPPIQRHVDRNAGGIFHAKLRSHQRQRGPSLHEPDVQSANRQLEA